MATPVNGTPVFLPGKFHEQRSLAGYSPWSHKELDTADRLTLSLPYFLTVSQFDALPQIPLSYHIPTIYHYLFIFLAIPQSMKHFTSLIRD